jgi:hypothetical protein
LSQIETSMKATSGCGAVPLERLTAAAERNLPVLREE